MPQPGLCGACKHAQRIQTKTSTFWRCGRHDHEPERYRKYPALPVLRCPGYTPSDADGTPA